MKKDQIKILKEEPYYLKILNELKVKGFDNLLIINNEPINYLDLVLNVLDFLETNKKIVKKTNSEQFENIVIILIDELLDKYSIDISEDQIEKVIKLLKNSMFVKKTSKFLINKIKNLKCC